MMKIKTQESKSSSEVKEILYEEFKTLNKIPIPIYYISNKTL